MKSKIASSILLALIFTIEECDSAYSQTAKIAVETGLTASLYSPKNKAVNSKNMMQPNTGILVILKPIKKLTVSSVLFYAPNSISVTNEQDKITGTFNQYSFYSIQTPLNVGYSNKVGYGNIWVQGGINLSYNFEAVKERWLRNMPVNDTLLDIQKSNVFSDKDNIVPRLELGLNASAAYILQFGLYARVQYGRSLNQIELSSDGKIRKQYINFNLGYIFKYKK
jgi:hypothetical protein